MKTADDSWTTIYEAEAGELDTSLGDSTGDATALDITAASRVVLLVSAQGTPGGASEIRIYPMIGDASSTIVYGYMTDLGGTEFYIPSNGITGTGNALPSIGVDGRHFKVDVTVDATDATATCTIKALRIYEEI